MMLLWDDKGGWTGRFKCCGRTFRVMRDDRLGMAVNKQDVDDFLEDATDREKEEFAAYCFEFEQSRGIH